MNTPTVSVLISNYNYDAFLQRAIDSVLAQTYSNLEIVVVDDGSTDRSRAILETYTGQICTLFKPNGGQASAFNLGIRACRGEWICLLDSDDYWIPDKVAWVVQVAKTYPEAQLIYHQVQNVTHDGAPLGSPWPRQVYSGNLALRLLRSGGWWPYPPTSALSFRRSFLESILEIPESDFRTCADAYLADLVPFIGQVFGIPKVLSDYRQHSRNCYAGGNVLTQKERYLLRHSNLNCALRDLGLAAQVFLEDHLPYQQLCYHLGETSRFDLSALALRFPWNSFAQKSRGLAGLWLRSRPTTLLREVHHENWLSTQSEHNSTSERWFGTHLPSIHLSSKTRSSTTRPR